MIKEIEEEIHRFWNEKGICPNALILGADVINELTRTYYIIATANAEKSHVCGCEILNIDHSNTKKIMAALI